MLQEEIRVPDGIGGYTRSWQDVVELWAEIKPISGNEKLLGNKIQPEVTSKLILRYRNDVTSGMRFLLGDRVFNIRYVINAGENNELLELLIDEGNIY